MQKEKWMLLGAMGIFGTIGLIVRYIPLSSAVIACARGFMGLVFLLGVMLLTKKKPDLPAIRKNLLLLAVSGAAMGFNWILLFESYRYTTNALDSVKLVNPKVTNEETINFNIYYRASNAD